MARQTRDAQRMRAAACYYLGSCVHVLVESRANSHIVIMVDLLWSSGSKFGATTAKPTRTPSCIALAMRSIFSISQRRESADSKARVNANQICYR